MANWLKYSSPDFIMAGSGNHLVEMENRLTAPDEEDYARCDECGEQTHVDFIVDRSDDNKVCQWCFVKMENEFFCNECCEEFLFKGVPAVCPQCGSFRIWHEFTSGNILVKEKQREYQTQLEDGQRHSAKILPFVPKTTAQSTKNTNKNAVTESDSKQGNCNGNKEQRVIGDGQYEFPVAPTLLIPHAR